MLLFLRILRIYEFLISKTIFCSVVMLLYIVIVELKQQLETKLKSKQKLKKKRRKENQKNSFLSIFSFLFHPSTDSSSAKPMEGMLPLSVLQQKQQKKKKSKISLLTRPVMPVQQQQKKRKSFFCRKLTITNSFLQSKKKKKTGAKNIFQFVQESGKEVLKVIRETWTRLTSLLRLRKHNCISCFQKRFFFQNRPNV